MQPLFEKYRPAHFSEVVGQDRAVKQLRLLQSRGGLAGRAYWITGPSGAGKTTLARLIAADVADDFAVQEIDAQWCTPARLRELESELHVRGWGDKGGKALIVNEAHGLSRDAIRQLLTMLERIPSHVAVVFTTTTENHQGMLDILDAPPLLSRCTRIHLGVFDNVSDTGRAQVTAFAERVRAIAQRESLDGQPLDRYIRLVVACKGNLRAALNAVESGDLLA